MAELSFSSRRVPFLLRGPDLEALGPLVERLPPATAPGERGGRIYCVRQVEGRWVLMRVYRRLAVGDTISFLADAFERDLHLYVAQNAPDFVFVHAGVVGWQGSCIVLPGRSLAGKSTLVAALLRRGATYYSDEYALFDREGNVHAYPRPLSLRRPEQAPLRLTAEDLNAFTGQEPRRIGIVAALRYQAGARLNVKPLSTGHALLTLLANTVPARERPQQAMDYLACGTRGSLGVVGTRGEAEEAAERLLRMAESLT